eukprot:4061222-Alexandrium_andersonii.AAC.1
MRSRRALHKTVRLPRTQQAKPGISRSTAQTRCFEGHVQESSQRAVHAGGAGEASKAVQHARVLLPSEQLPAGK